MGLAKPIFSNGSLDLPPYLGQDWFQHGRSEEIGHNADFAQCMLPFMTLGAMHSKGHVRDLELVLGALHF